jgi:hypothetical protein
MFAPGADLDPKIDNSWKGSKEPDPAYILRYFAGAYSTILDGADCRVLITRINLMRSDTAAVDGQIIITSTTADGKEVRYPWVAFVSRHRGLWLIDSGYLPTAGVVMPPRPNQRLLPTGPAASTFELVAAAGAAAPRNRSAIR